MSKNGYSDKEIINGILTLNPKIYEYFDERYREEVIRYVRRNSGAKEDGEEHYQDIIFEVYLNIDEGRYNANSSGTFQQFFWLVTKRRWLDKLRKKGRINTSELNELAMQIASKDEAEERAEDTQNKLILAINKHLKQLTEEEQKYIELFYFAKESLQAIAEYFGTSYEYARLKLHRIREKLRRRIKDDPEFGVLIN